MSFQQKKLQTLMYSGNWTYWRYEPGEDDIESEGYFDRASQLRTGDLMIVSLPGPKHKFYTVTQAKSGEVIVKEMGKEHQFTSRDHPSKRKGKKDGNQKDEGQAGA